MAQKVTPPQVHTSFKEHFRERPDIGVREAVLNLILVPRSPFEPEQRRQPKRGFLIGAVFVLVALGWFTYFNFVH